MKGFVVLMILIALFCVILCYMCCIVAARSDERAQKMFEEYKRENLKKD